jgi:hypothetical protein
MQVEHRITVAAPPERLFAIYEDVSNWHTWDPDTRQASLQGPFEAGSCGRLTPTRGRTVPMKITDVVRDRSFTVESRIPMFRMVFEHELLPRDAATEVVHRVTFSGLLSAVIGRVLSRQLDEGLPRTLANLKQLAEADGRR